MSVFRLIGRVLHVLGFVVASLCTNEVEYDGNYADNYDNEISQDQQEDASPTPLYAADFSRWDKLFIALEDSHMKQNMLLESVEQCCGGVIHLSTQVDKLVRGNLLQRVPSIEAACRAQVEQVGVRLQREMDELREAEAKRETRLNVTLQTLLSSSREGNVWLKRLEEDRRTTAAPASRREPEATTPLDVPAKEGGLVAVTTELEKVGLLLTRVITQVEALRRDRGDV